MHIPRVQKRISRGEQLAVEAYDRDRSFKFVGHGQARGDRQPGRLADRHRAAQGGLRERRRTICSPTSSSTPGCWSRRSSDATVDAHGRRAARPDSTFRLRRQAGRDGRDAQRRCSARPKGKRPPSKADWRRATSWSPTASTNCSRVPKFRWPSPSANTRQAATSGEQRTSGSDSRSSARHGRSQATSRVRGCRALVRPPAASQRRQPAQP